MPRTFVWNKAIRDKYPSVRAFAQRMKMATMTAHDAILEVRTKQTCMANRKRRIAPFENGNLAYVSTKNMSLPKGHARKLIPKYIGPYKIVRDFGNNSFELDLPARLKQRGIHPVFHSSLLRIHVPNDDRLFPGRQETQVADFGETEPEWSVERILSHYGSSTDALFEVKWASGNITWLAYPEVSHLSALSEYLELVETDEIRNLSRGNGHPSDDPQVFVGACLITEEWSSSLVSPSFTMAHDDLSRSAHIFRRGDDFVFVDIADTGAFVVPRWHMHLCLEYSKRMHAVVYKKNLDPPPIGYDIIACTYNGELGIITNFSEFDVMGCCLLCPLPEPSPYTFFGNHPPPPPMSDIQLRQQALVEAFADGELSKRNRIQNSIKERRMRKGKKNSLQDYSMPTEGKAKRRRERSPSPHYHSWKAHDEDDDYLEPIAGTSSRDEERRENMEEAEAVAGRRTSTQKEAKGDHVMSDTSAHLSADE